MKALRSLACLAVLVLSAALALPGGAVLAQEGAGRDVIRRIVIEGTQRIEPETVRSYLLLNEGDVYDPEAVDRALKTLFDTGLFDDVTIRRDNGDVVIAVVENPIINRVIYEGNKRLDAEKLEEEVQLRPRIVLTKTKVQADVQRIVELYRRSGRFAAVVNPKIVQLPQNRVDLIFEISEGPLTGVSRINFLGNKAYGDGKLRGVVLTEESRWWRFLTSNDNYDPDRLTYDRELLRRFYLKNGYADFRVVSAVAELAPDREEFFITYTLEEGEQYEVGETSVVTSLEQLDAAQLQSLVLLRKGQVYNADLIDDTIEAMTYAAGVQGYAFVDIRPRVQRKTDDRVIDVVFQVDEGPRVYVERINIAGNTRTLDKVIRREFRLVEGDAYNKVLIDRSKARIRGLGFFKEVEITEEPGSAPDRTVLNVAVEEESTGELNLGAGFSSADNFLAEVSISERNFLGRGQFLRASASVSGRRQLFDLRFTEPYFLDRNLSAGFDLFKARTDYQTESSFDTDSFGFGLRSGFPLTEFARLSPRYTFRVDDITDVDSFASLAILTAEGESTTSAVGATYFLDRRNDPLEPTRGFDFVIEEDVAGLGGDVNYVRSEIGAGWYYGIIKDMVLSVRGDAGYIFGWGGEDVRLNDRFLKGGQSFRGFEPSGVGPRDPVTGDAVGGNAYAIGSVEVSFPLGLPEEFGVTASLFSDFGAVGLVDEKTFRLDRDGDGIAEVSTLEDDFSPRLSVGVSVFWKSPFGPIRLNFAEVLVQEDYDESQFFQFSGGTRF